MTRDPSPETDAARDRMDDSLLEETVDGRFRLDERLGEGAVGRVYKATQLSIDRPVALKVLHGDFRRDSEFQKRFQREAKVISGFNHPNIVRLVDFGEDETHEFTYLVMEYIEGIELLQLIQRGRLVPQFALDITDQLCAGLMAAHDQDIVHRDLKAENVILVSVPGGIFQAKVLDFGVAFPIESNVRLTSGREIFGTPAYMSPEQTEGHDVDPTSDLYSLGVLLFEMITGDLPFEAPSSMRMMVKHFEKAPPDLGDKLPDDEVPAGLNELVQALLSKAPSDRPQSGEVVRERIEAIRQLNGWSSLRVDADRPLEDVFADWIIEQPDLHTEAKLGSSVSSEDFAMANTVVAAADALTDSKEGESLPSERARTRVDPESEVADDVANTLSNPNGATVRSPSNDRTSTDELGRAAPRRPDGVEEDEETERMWSPEREGPPPPSQSASGGSTSASQQQETPSSWDPPPIARDGESHRLEPTESSKSTAVQTQHLEERSSAQAPSATSTGGRGRERTIALVAVGSVVLLAAVIFGYWLSTSNSKASSRESEATVSNGAGTTGDFRGELPRLDADGPLPSRDAGAGTVSGDHATTASRDAFERNDHASSARDDTPESRPRPSLDVSGTSPVRSESKDDGRETGDAR